MKDANVVSLLTPHLDAVRVRIGLQDTLGAMLAELPTEAARATAIRDAWLSAIITSRKIHKAIRMQENSGVLLPFRRRPVR